MELIKVKDHNGLYRDPVSKAIIVNDSEAYVRARAERLKAQRAEQRINNLEESVRRIEAALNHILTVVDGGRDKWQGS